MKNFEDFLGVNFNFGILLTLYPDTPSDWTYPDGTYNILLKQNNQTFDQFYLKPEYWFKNFHKHYAPLEIELYGLEGQEMVKLFYHKFNIENQLILFDLYPNNSEEVKIWLEYLQIFQYETKCNVYVNSTIEFPHNFNLHNPEILYYASYRVSWDNDIYQNVLGIDCTPFDLINNQLLRL